MKSKIYRILEPDTPPEITGNGKKGLLIVIQADDKSENEATLQGLVKAIKFDILEDVTIISCKGKFTSINTVLKSQNFNTVILMGIEPSEVGFAINAKNYFFYKMEGFSILLTDSLKAMNTEKSKKMAFWQNLQDRFLK